MTIALARITQTCGSHPAQWDAWTVDGQYLYLRYRFGRGTVDAYDGPGPDGSMPRTGALPNSATPGSP